MMHCRVNLVVLILCYSSLVCPNLKDCLSLSRTSGVVSFFHPPSVPFLQYVLGRWLRIVGFNKFWYKSTLVNGSVDAPRPYISSLVRVYGSLHLFHSTALGIFRLQR